MQSSSTALQLNCLQKVARLHLRLPRWREVEEVVVVVVVEEVGMAFARAAWTSAWMLVLPLTGCSSCAWRAAARGAVAEVESGEEKVMKPNPRLLCKWELIM